MTTVKFQPRHPLRFLVRVDADRGNARHYVEGMLRYAHECEPVEFLMTSGPVNLKAYPPIHGFIYERDSMEDIARLLKTSLPSVALTDPSPPDAYRVICDDYAIGRVGFEHLRELGLRNFSYFDTTHAVFSQRRLAGFRDAARAAGFGVILPPKPSWNPEHRPKMRTWLKNLPQPLGMMTSVMEWGEVMIRMCHEAGLTVPDQIAVLTVDDDELACQMVTPSLSTIDTGAYQIGYRAVELLVQLVRGKRPKEKTIVVPPGELIVRQSTDMLAIDDPLLGSAVRFIRQYACDGIHVSDVLRHVPMSRRGLEYAFQRTLNRTVHDEILRIRLGKARQLLSSTDLSLAHIATKSAFSSTSVFCRIFRRETDMTPMAYRRKTRRQ